MGKKAPRITSKVTNRIYKLISALQEIEKKSINCIGPGCVYCQDELEHPKTWESKLAKDALIKTKLLEAQGPIDAIEKIES